MTVLFLILVVIVSAVVSLHWYQTRSHVAKLLNSFPGPSTVPLAGNVFQYSQDRRKIFQDLRLRLKRYNQTFREWSVHYSCLHIITANDAEIILSSKKLIDKSKIYEFLKPIIGTGLITSSGIKWQHRRKLLSPAFHVNILRRFVPIFGKHCEKLIQQLQVESKKPKFDIFPLINNFALATLSETTMGIKTDERDNTQKQYSKALHNVPKIILIRVLRPWFYINAIFNLSYWGWVQRRYLKMLHAFTASVIKERELNFKNKDVENLEENDENMYVGKKRLAMLDLLISAKRNDKAITNEGIREVVDTFMAAGHDTTAVAISYILLTLANQQDFQEKIIVEIDDIFGDTKRPASVEDLQKMKYTEMCIKECLRLYPVAPFISRILCEDTPLTHHTAPAGTTVLIHIYDIHRDPKYFSDPKKFDPDRFLPENCKERNPYAFIPFSAGPRNCIGQKFAMYELKSVVACILRNFRLEPITIPSDLIWMADFVLRTNSPINIKFKKRS